MAYKEGVAELLDKISKLESRDDRIAALRAQHNIALETIIDLCFNPHIKWALPPGEPPFKLQPKESDNQAVLFANLRKFGIFIESGPYPTMKQFNREIQFVNFLESLDPDDAKLVVSVKDKIMPYKGITKKMFNRAWPALAATWEIEGEAEVETDE